MKKHPKLEEIRNRLTPEKRAELEKMPNPIVEVSTYCDCDFVMIMRDQKTQRAYCSECKKEVIE